MKSIKIKVVPNADKNEIIEEGDRLKIKVTSPPAGGRANKKVVEMLAKFYGVKKKCIRIKKGLRSREKVIEIEED
ncbi:MAG TPA: DUF167 domain-containing protein [Thermoplasmatales archaeon]|nr:DUF167 domain-containing protein [Thermoplasmatales archaeon]